MVLLSDKIRKYQGHPKYVGNQRQLGAPDASTIPLLVLIKTVPCKEGEFATLKRLYGPVHRQKDLYLHLA